MIELSAALAFAALCAWDVSRRAINAKHDASAARDVAAVAGEVDKTNQVVEALAVDWRAKFGELEKLHRELEHRVNGKLTGAPRTTGYNR